MVKRKKNTKGQTMIYKTLHKNLKIEQHESNYKLGVNSGAPEGLAVPGPLVTLSIVCPLVFFFLLTIALSVLLRFTASDHHFGIFKPFYEYH
jgi:hypothetical protein